MISDKDWIILCSVKDGKYLRVDDANHAGLAMVSLRAVVPNRFRVIDHDCVCGNHCVCGLDKHVTREQAFHPHGVLHRHARHIEGCLYNGVVLKECVSLCVPTLYKEEADPCIELELHHLPDLGLKIFGIKYMTSSLVRDLDNMYVDHATARGSSSSSHSRRSSHRHRRRRSHVSHHRAAHARSTTSAILRHGYAGQEKGRCKRKC